MLRETRLTLQDRTTFPPNYRSAVEGGKRLQPSRGGQAVVFLAIIASCWLGSLVPASAENMALGKSYEIRAVLLLGGAFPEGLRALRNMLGVEVIECVVAL